MAQKIRIGLFKKTTRYKTLWCNHADWITFKALAARMNRTMIETLHEVMRVYIECIEQNHKKQISDMQDKVDILALELRS